MPILQISNLVDASSFDAALDGSNVEDAALDGSNVEDADTTLVNFRIGVFKSCFY